MNGYAGNDLIVVMLTTNIGGIYVGAANSYNGGAGNDTIEITGSNSWAAFQTFTAANGVETIKGDGTGDDIVAGYNTATGLAFGPLDLSATTLVGINQILGSTVNDDIKGSTGADNIDARQGNDTIRESGGSDRIDGGTGTNSFIANSASTSYTPLLTDSGGHPVFNNGTTWKFLDAQGATINMYNIQSVVFTNKTLYSTVNNQNAIGPSNFGTDLVSPSMLFIHDPTIDPSATGSLAQLPDNLSVADLGPDTMPPSSIGTSALPSATENLWGGYAMLQENGVPAPLFQDLG